MKTLQFSPSFISTEHLNFEVDEEGVLITSQFKIEDVWINTPDVGILWWIACPPDIQRFDDAQGFLMPAKNDPKEFGNVNCSHMAFRSLKGKGRIFLIMQRN